MPGMVHLDGSPVTQSSVSQACSRASPLQSFSFLTLSPLSSPKVSSNHVLVASPGSGSRVQDLKSEERGLFLIQILLQCVASAADHKIDYTNLYLEQLSLLTSVTGDPMQRVASYFMQGLALRIVKAWPGIYQALNCTNHPLLADTLAAKQVFFNVCPYLKFAYTVANQCILDAIEGEKVVHIIDLGATEATQWIALLQILILRMGGPPHLRITIINERKELLDWLGQRLCEEAENLDIPFQFHPVVTKLENLDVEMLRVKSGEAVAVSSILQLHYLLSDDLGIPSSAGLHHSSHHSSGQVMESPVSNTFIRKSNRDAAVPSVNIDDRGMKRTRNWANLISSSSSHQDTYQTLGELLESAATETTVVNAREIPCGDIVEHNGVTSRPRPNNSCTSADRILGMLRMLAPKVMVVMEQEGSHNSPNIMERFVEALHYYSAIFDSLESTLSSSVFMERLTLEKHLFGREIVNIVGCEGLERIERHERMENWRKRAEQVGFLHLAFSYSTFMQAKQLLMCTNESFKLVQDRGCLTLCWQDTPLFSAWAWQS